MEPVFVGVDGIHEPDPKYILHDIDEEEGEEGEETTRNVDSGSGIPASETCPNIPEEDNSPEIIMANEQKEEKVVSDIQSEPPVKKD